MSLLWDIGIIIHSVPLNGRFTGQTIRYIITTRRTLRFQDNPFIVVRITQDHGLNLTIQPNLTTIEPKVLSLSILPVDIWLTINCIVH